MVKYRTYYDLLGLPFGASPDEVKVRYRELAKRYHPDVNPSPEAARLMQEINEAYRVLTDPRLRLAYHLRLAAYAMRRSQKTAAPAPPRPSPPMVMPLSYPLWLLLFLLGVVVASAVGYHWLHPFTPSQAHISGYGFETLPPYLYLPFSLKKVDLSHNRLSAIPPQLFTLPALLSLNFSHNSLTTLPAEIYQWRRLEELDLSYNQLSVLPWGWGELSNLRHLDLRHNQLKTIPLEILTMPSLRYLDLRGNPLSPEMRYILQQWRERVPITILTD